MGSVEMPGERCASAIVAVRKPNTIREQDAPTTLSAYSGRGGDALGNRPTFWLKPDLAGFSGSSVAF